ncbi:MAG: hypothetical protein NZ914_15140, partial [Gemmatales bacterium]|nr:hypothetical protein [Gemmatales bacterium]
LGGLSISPDGKLLAVGECGRVCLHDASTGLMVRELDTQSGKFIREVEMSNDLSKLLSAEYEELTALTFSPDGKFLAAALHGRKSRWPVEKGQERLAHTGTWIQVWEVSSGKTLVRWDVGKQCPRVFGLAYAADGKILGVAGDSPRITVWEPHTGKLVRAWNMYDEATPNAVPRVGQATVVSDLKYARIREQGFWLSASATPGIVYGRPNSVNQGLVSVWDETGRLLHTLPHDGAVRALAVGESGQWLASVESLKWPKSWPQPLPPMLPEAAPEEFHSEVYIWETATGRKRAVLPLGTRPATGLAAAPDGRWLAACFSNHEKMAAIVVWHLPARLP